MAMPLKPFDFLVQHVAPLCLQWPLAQLFPTFSQAVLTIALSLMSIDKAKNHILNSFQCCHFIIN